MKTLHAILDLVELLIVAISKIKAVWWLIVFVVLAVLYVFCDHLFLAYFPENNEWYEPAALSVFMLLPVSVFFTLPYWLKELQLLRSADHPALMDGQRTAVHGTLKSTGSTLTTPFTGRPCLYYQYEIVHTPYNANYSTTDYQGFAKPAPLVVQSSMGDVPLVDYVTPTETFRTNAGNPSIASIIDAFIKETTFEESWDAYSQAKSGGNYRRKGASIGLPRQEVIEQHFPVGTELCVIGEWSSSSAGLKSVGMAQRTYRILKGNPKEARLPIFRQIGKNILVAFLLAGFINFLAFVIFTAH